MCLALLLAAIGLSSCLNAPDGGHRVAVSGGTAACPGDPPPRLTIGPETTVPLPGGLGQRHPAVAYGDGVYLLVWQEGFDGAGGAADILALRVGPDGRALDREPIVICGQPAGFGKRTAARQGPPAVAFCAGRFLVTWAPRPLGGPEELYPLRTRGLDARGALDLQTHSMFGPNLKVNPAIASNGKDQFLLVWEEYVGDRFEVRATRVSAAEDNWLDVPNLRLASPEDPPAGDWATGGRLAAAWTGSGYVVGQSVCATWLGPDGRTILPVTRTWNRASFRGYAAASAWGRGLVFACIRPNPDPWGWSGNGAIVGMTVAPDGARREWEQFSAMIPDKDKTRESFLLADGFVPNCLDAARWLNHPGWPMGMPGGFKHAMGDLWPSGTPAAAHDGESLVVVWPRAHMVDNRRLANRDLCLTRVLPGWSLVDPVPVVVSGGPAEETNPVLCAGARGQTLLAYEKVTESGVVVRYRMLAESPDTAPPCVAYVAPKSRTELVVGFDEPVDEASASQAGNYRIDGLAVTAAAFVPDGRGRRREVILTTAPPEIGRRYTLRVSGVKDRSPAANAAQGAEFSFLARPGLMNRCDKIGRWDTDDSMGTIANPSLTGFRDYICRWNLLGPLPLDRARHPFDPATLEPSPGDEVRASGGGALKWQVAENEAVDLGGIFGEKDNATAYAATYVFSDGARRAVLRLDSNDHNRAWLNGRLVHDGITDAKGSRGFHDYSDEVPVALRSGWNRLLVQVENQKGTWMMVGQITDEAGRPIRDLTWQLERPEGL